VFCICTGADNEQGVILSKSSAAEEKNDQYCNMRHHRSQERPADNAEETSTRRGS